jgi:signal transduction histidine kinase
MTAIDWTTLVPPWLPSLQLGVLITDTALVIRYWCPWLERHSGRSAAEMQGQPLLSCFPTLREGGLDAVYARALAGETVDLQQRRHPYLIPLPPSEPRSPFAQMQQGVRIAPLAIEGTIAGTISTITDTTEQAVEAQAAQRARATAEEALQVRDSFFSLAAHELRTPLTTLLGRAQMLQRWLGDDAQLPERTQRSVGIMVEQAQRLNGMVSAMLDVSRVQAGRLALSSARVELAALVRRIVAEQPASRHTLQLDLPAEPLLVWGDEARLAQVVRALLSNAVKYSPEGGAVEVRLRCDGESALLTVRDEGIGLPPEARGQLFQRFYRAENAEKLGISGLGIGLFVARGIVDLHQGQIEVESAEGRGSRFTVRLPLLPGEAPA